MGHVETDLDQESQSTTSTLAERVSNELLPHVKQPAQYIGGEVNQLVGPGDWQRADVRIVVAFPDAYTIGTSHLGTQILYWIANHTPGVCGERAYTPWIDAEEIMRDRQIPLFTWDTRQPVRDADILALSLQYELVFTNLLTMLDLAGIPFRAADRTEVDPLILVGGPQADNPEPVAEFVDLVVMGDGEHALAEILATVKELKAAGVPRRAMIRELARRFAWLYAPNLYTPTYNADGTLAALTPSEPDLPTHIARCQTPDFEAVPVPTRPLVPWVQSVHDRISIEIMRGCPQVCRFCHAGYTKRPLHWRSVDRIVEIAEETYWATGHDEIGLLSLSTGDYPRLGELAEKLNDRFRSRRVSLSFPSLRVDRMLQNIPFLGNEVRKGGLTLAVEAASDDLRRVIRKKVTDGNLLDGVRAAYEAGWKRVKIYFMAGFPGERQEDIDRIWELACAVSDERRKLGKPPASVTASIGWLVPKPFTPMQWSAQPPAEYFDEVRRRLLALKGSSRRRDIRLNFHSVARSVLEAVLARGDRRLGPAIVAAWKRGARFDGWDDCFNPDLWHEAFADVGRDPAFYAARARHRDELLPWDHVRLHMPRHFLERGDEELRRFQCEAPEECPASPTALGTPPA